MRRKIRDYCGLISKTTEQFCAFQIRSTLYIVGIYNFYLICTLRRKLIRPDSQTVLWFYLLHFSVWVTKQIVQKKCSSAFCSHAVSLALQTKWECLTEPNPFLMMKQVSLTDLIRLRFPYYPLDIKWYYLGYSLNMKFIYQTWHFTQQEIMDLIYNVL